VAEARAARGLLDTSVVIDLERIDPASLPATMAVSAVTMAELAAGPHATTDRDERARRQERLQRAEATFAPLAFDARAARAFGRLYAAVAGKGRKTRGRRAVDLLIAATAIAEELPLYTRNPDDFAGFGDLLDLRTVDLVAKR
jgi:predicted nucleic acid-binding protein